MTLEEKLKDALESREFSRTAVLDLTAAIKQIKLEIKERNRLAYEKTKRPRCEAFVKYPSLIRIGSVRTCSFKSSTSLNGKYFCTRHARLLLKNGPVV